MIRIRRDSEIHDIDGGWFRARWHFSFDSYQDPANDSFGAMRVFNDDRLIPGAVWPLHPHRDVEGLTYVVEGSFGHQDNVGGAFGPLPAGSVQRMTLGSGALHSELNASKTEPMRFIQIWILPDTPSLPPQVEQRVFTRADRTNRLLQVIGPEGDDVVSVHQDASVHVASLDPGVEVTHLIGAGRGAYAYLISGAGLFDDEPVATGDAAKVTDQSELRIRATEASELILVDVPMTFEPVGIWKGRI
jgi:redox-sensitive bicupin YhaK (pirin superfamily)